MTEATKGYKAGSAAEEVPPAAARPRGEGQAEGTAKKRAPKRRAAKTGAPTLNSNRQTHGLDSKPEVVAMRFELGALAGAHKRVEGDVYAFRRLIETAVLDVKGSISLIDAAFIQTACRHERASRLALAWLREHETEMGHAERLAYNKAIADSSAARDKTLERLKIDAESEAWNPASIYDTPLEVLHARYAAQQAAQQRDAQAIAGPVDTLVEPAAADASSASVDVREFRENSSTIPPEK